jgi:hypothetical protein
MNVIDAADATVHEYPGGSETLAIRLDMSAAVLRGKVNVNNDRNHLTLAEADRIMSLTGDHRILQALAAQHGYVLVRSEDQAIDAGGESVGQLMLKVAVAEGEFSRTVHDAAADGVITANEAVQITADGLAVQRTVIWALQRMRALVGRRGVS